MSDVKFVAVLVVLLIFFMTSMICSYCEGTVIALLTAWGLWNDARVDRLTGRLRLYQNAQNELIAELCEEADNGDDRC